MNSGIGKDRRASRPPVTRRVPGHVLVHPDQQRHPLAQRRVVAAPVRRARAGGRRLAHTPPLTPWIRVVNPLALEMCNDAPPMETLERQGCPRGTDRKGRKALPSACKSRGKPVSSDKRRLTRRNSIEVTFRRLNDSQRVATGNKACSKAFIQATALAATVIDRL